MSVRIAKKTNVYRGPDVAIGLEDGRALFKSMRALNAERFEAYRKAVEGARYDWDRRLNVAPLSSVLPILYRLKDAKFEALLMDDLRAALVERAKVERAMREAAQARAAKIDEELKKRGLGLYPFQREGVAWLAARDRALLFDEQGLGKSVQLLAAHSDVDGLLIICPSVMKGVWANEAERFRPDLRVSILSGRGSFRWPEPGEMVVVNPDILPDVEEARRKCEQAEAFLFGLNEENEAVDDGEMWEEDGPVEDWEEGPEGGVHELDVPENDGVEIAEEALRPLPPLENVITVGFDEAHAYKNWRSKRSKVARSISEAVMAAGGRAWALTGTPLHGKPQELWSVLRLVNLAHDAYGTYGNFKNLFGAYEDDYGYVRWASNPDPTVVERLKRVSLRRERKDVLKDLPDKVYREIVVSIDAGAMRLGDLAMAELLKAGVDLESAERLAEETKKGNVGEELGLISKAREALAVAKIPAMLEVIKTYEEAGEPLVVFSAHRGPVDVLGKRRGWATITGDNSEDAAKIAELFQKGHVKWLAATIAAGGVGITLTAAHEMLFVDRDWTPALNWQSEDRCNRIGQKNAVIITDLIADHAMDKHVHKVLRKKELLIERTVEASALKEGEAPRQLDLERILP